MIFNTHFRGVARSLLMLLLAPPIFAQNGTWELQHPQNPVNTFTHIYVSPTDGYGWITAPFTLLHSNDGGQTWSLQAQDQSLITDTYSLLTIQYEEGSNGQHLYILRTSHILESNDGGNSWELISFGTPPPVQAKDMRLFANGDLLVLDTDKVYHSSDGGENWTTTLEAGQNLQNMSFGTETDGWIAAENGILYHTSDGGLSWTEVNSFPLSENILVSFIDGQIGFVSTDSQKLFKSADAGQSWTLIAEDAFGPLAGFHAEDENHLYGRYVNRGYYSNDGGLTWDFFSAGTSSMGSGSYSANGEAWMVGDLGAIFYRPDSGTDWSDLNTENRQDLFFASFYDQNIGFAGGAYGIFLKTTDGGENWEDLSPEETPVSSGSFLYDALWLDQNTLLIAGKSNIFHYTSDWSDPLLSSGNSFYDLARTPSGTIFACGHAGKIAKSDNTGNNWEYIINTPSNPSLRAIDFYDDNNGIAAGDMGTIMRTTDGGNSWDSLNAGTDKLIPAICYANINAIWASTAEYTDSLLFSSDQGNTWEKVSVGQSAFYYDCYFEDELSGWLAGGYGSGGVLLHTTDGGEHWELFATFPQVINQVQVQRDLTSLTLHLAGRIAHIFRYDEFVISTKEAGYTEKPLQLYPIPLAATASLNVSLPSNLPPNSPYFLYDAEGRRVQSGLTGNRQSLLIKNLPKGLFTLFILDELHSIRYVGKGLRQ